MDKKTQHGTIDQALAHYLELISLDEERQEESVNIISQFTDTSKETVHSWLKKERLPNGITLLKLIHLFKLSGAQLPMGEISPEGDGLGKLIAFDVIDVDMAMEEFGYDSRGTIFRIVLGKQGIHPSKIDRIREIINSFRDSLTKSQKETALLSLKKPAPTNFSTSTESDMDIARNTPKSPPAEEAAFMRQVKEGRIISGGSVGVLARINEQEEFIKNTGVGVDETLSVLFAAIIPLLKIVLSDSFPKESRSKLEEKASELLNILQKIQK